MMMMCGEYDAVCVHNNEMLLPLHVISSTLPVIVAKCTCICAVSWMEEGEYKWKLLSSCSIVYYYNGAQR